MAPLGGYRPRIMAVSNSTHQKLNDLVPRALLSAGVPTRKELVGLTRRDGKRPNGRTTQIPWRSRKLLVWDVTVVNSRKRTQRGISDHRLLMCYYFSLDGIQTQSISNIYISTLFIYLFIYLFINNFSFYTFFFSSFFLLFFFIPSLYLFL